MCFQIVVLWHTSVTLKFQVLPQPLKTNKQTDPDNDHPKQEISITQFHLFQRWLILGKSYLTIDFPQPFQVAVLHKNNTKASKPQNTVSIPPW